MSILASQGIVIARAASEIIETAKMKEKKVYELMSKIRNFK